MKCLDETPRQVAMRMRSLADGVTKESDATEIRRYADWLERSLDGQQTLRKGP